MNISKKITYFCQLKNFKPYVSTVLSMKIALITTYDVKK